MTCGIIRSTPGLCPGLLVHLVGGIAQRTGSFVSAVPEKAGDKAGEALKGQEHPQRSSAGLMSETTSGCLARRDDPWECPTAGGWGPTRLLLSPVIWGADDGGQSCLALVGGCWDQALHSPISFNQGNAQLCPGPGGVTGGLTTWHTQPRLRQQPGLRWPRSSALPNANCI